MASHDLADPREVGWPSAGIGEHSGAYLGFARRWRAALGSTQLEIVEDKELPDGRLFTVLKHSGAGTHSGAGVERRTVQLLSFKGDKVTRTEVYGDLSQGRAAAGLGR